MKSVTHSFGNLALVTALAVGASIAIACEDKKPAEPEPTASAEPAAKEEAPKEEEKPEEPKEEEKAEVDAGAAEEKDEKAEAKGEETKKAPAKTASAKAPAKAAAAKPTEAKKEEEKKPEVPAYSGPNPCKRTSFAFGSVRSACQRGGQKAAKDLMRVVVKKARDGGEKMKCTSCHTDTKSYANTPNAVADFRKWLTAK